jgi:surfactin synthase thioesterase subunit
MNPVTVVCFPPAGAGPSFFQAWPGSSPAVRFVPVDLPGKERRFTEEPPDRIPDLARAVLPDVRAEIGDAPRAAVLGHCFGALLAYEVVRTLTQDGHEGELTLVVSGSRPPGVAPTAATLTGLPDEEFLAGIRRIAGYRHPALDDAELRDLLLPALRADVAAHESYRPAWAGPMAHPALTVRGTRDGLVSGASASAWRSVTSGRFHSEEIPGPHMYLTEAWPQLVALLERTLHGDRSTW